MSIFLKALLLNPPFEGKTIERRGRCTRLDPHGWIHPPLHLMYYSSVLKKQGIEAKVLDAIAEKKSADDVIEFCRSFSPDFIVSWTGNFSYAIDIKILEKIKGHFPKITTFLTGTDLVIAKPELFLSKPFIDFTISGEAELALQDIPKFIAGRMKKSKVRNISYLQKGEVKKNRHGLIENLDDIPFPDRGAVDNSLYKGFPFFSESFTDLLTSRGCPFNCTICTSRLYWGSSYRERSAENILAEIEECVDKYRIKTFFILDDTFNLNKKKVIRLCRMIVKKGIRIKWGCQTRVDLVDDEMLKAMADAGCVYIHYGAESGVQRLLDYFNKGIAPEQTIKAFELTRKYGIENCATFIVGTPVDKPGDLEKTLELYRKIKPDYVHVSPLIPIVGSPIYHQMKKEGILKHEDYSKYVKPNINFRPKYMTEDEIRKEYREAWRTMSLDKGYVSRNFVRAFKKGDARFFFESFRAGLWILKTFFIQPKGEED